jgi:hypothetical protein
MTISKKYPWALLFIVGGVFVLGLLVRLVDLTDPPLDFNPTRQLRSAIIARGLYYQSAPDVDPAKREVAIDHLGAMERLEPPIFEHIVAFTYRLMGGENLWVARVYTSVFWLIGGIVLFDLGRRMTSPWAALVGLGYYFFLPFSIRASRSFQPDPGMVMLILLTTWALYLWSDKRTWKWAILAGVFGGLAVLVKGVAVFFVGGISVGVVGYVLGTGENAKWRLTNLKSGFRSAQVWVMAILMAAPVVLYYLIGSGGQSPGYSASWTILARWRDVLDASFFMRWLIWVDEIMVLAVVLAAFVGSLVTSPRNRALLWGFWGGYLFFGLTFPYHIITHDYYHLTLVGLAALSLMPLAELVLEKVAKQGRVVQGTLAGIVLVFLVYNGWIGRSILVGQDFSAHPAYWQMVAEAIPSDEKAVGLTQDYGARLMYYGWRKIGLWPSAQGSADFEAHPPDAGYFVITAPGQLREDLKTYLETHFPVYDQGEGFIIYDLQP